jgi:hypothetical protein
MTRGLSGNAYQELVMRELEQRRKAKGKQRVDLVEDIKISNVREANDNITICALRL